MWLLSFLPDSMLLYVVNSILIAGAIGSFLSFFVLHKILNKFPALAPYHLLIQIVSAALLVAGIYFKGGYSVEMEWREKVAELEVKLEEAKKESAKVNTVVETKIVTKTKVIKEKADAVIQYVDRPVMQEFDKTCPIPREAIDVHNEAARMNKAIEEMRKGAAK
jgi:preprotein translocase subunit SecF